MQRIGATGSQRESRSGLLRRGTEGTSESGHALRTPGEGTVEAENMRAIMMRYTKTEMRLFPAQKHRGEVWGEEALRAGEMGSTGGQWI